MCTLDEYLSTNVSNHVNLLLYLLRHFENKEDDKIMGFLSHVLLYRINMGHHNCNF